MTEPSTPSVVGWWPEPTAPEGTDPNETALAAALNAASPDPSPPDLVYVVRPGDVNDELRYSLRSVAENLPHRRVWVVGHMPPWLRDVHHLPTVQSDTKYRNSTGNVRAACEHPEVSDPFVLMNDDFYVLKHTPFIPALHRGRVDKVATEYEARYGWSKYLEGMEQTRELLAELGVTDPLSYELHVPMTVEKEHMLEALSLGAALPVLHKRTLYGNLAEIGGEETGDVKVSRGRAEWSPLWTYLSTDPKSWRGGAGEFVRMRFKERSRYEEVTAEHPGGAALTETETTAPLP